MFSLLTDKLEDAFRKLRGLGKISESNIAEAMKDIRLALLEATLQQAAPGVVLAGASFRGIGIPACVQQARTAASSVLARLDAHN